jgi:hypothetical protein
VSVPVLAFPVLVDPTLLHRLHQSSLGLFHHRHSIQVLVEILLLLKA